MSKTFTIKRIILTEEKIENNEAKRFAFLLRERKHKLLLRRARNCRTDYPEKQKPATDMHVKPVDPPPFLKPTQEQRNKRTKQYKAFCAANNLHECQFESLTRFKKEYTKTTAVA